MAKITDQDYMTACSNGDGTYDARKAIAWLMEATKGMVSPEQSKQIAVKTLVEVAKKNAAKKAAEVDIFDDL